MLSSRKPKVKKKIPKDSDMECPSYTEKAKYRVQGKSYKVCEIEEDEIVKMYRSLNKTLDDINLRSGLHA